MAKQEKRLYSKEMVMRAFNYAICNSSCKGSAERAKECIEGRKICPKRTNFLKKLDD
jgi:hypothetical protein